jgi:predicted Zn-ribbon and HTH transcriptional regulator
MTLEEAIRRLAEANAEIARLRALMTTMSRTKCSHIIQHSTYPTPEEYEAAKARDIHLGPTIHYTCGIHADRVMPGGRCPECDSTADSA